MPAKLYIFAIGGTGSRVLKSLTMLMASGIEMNEVTEVVPIILDPHKDNKDVQRTEVLINKYRQIRASLKSDLVKGDFFYTPIKTLEDIVRKSDGIGTTPMLTLKDSHKTFKDYIDFEGLNDANKALASLLFSKENLDTEMDIGFVGNPNIGSVVLNQFAESDEFKNFASNFTPNDRIFIISSIFGGTGAAGFPLILKNIRGADKNPKLTNTEYLKNAKIGALTVMPYFGIKPTDDKKVVDKSTFISKTKAALQYYARGVNKDLNRMYYIGDLVNLDYEYDPGKDGQQNNAHFVELASALAIVDFANAMDTDLETENGKPKLPVYKEFGIREDDEILNLKSLSVSTQQVLSLPLSQLVLFSLYLDNRLGSAIDSRIPWIVENPPIDRSFSRGNFVEIYLNEFNQLFKEWLDEMKNNRRAFDAYLTDTNDDLSGVIKGYSPKKGVLGFGTSTVDFKTIDEANNSIVKGKNYPTPADKLIKVMSEGTRKVLSEKFPDLFQNIKK
ncbi:MAG: hypothetical protein MUF58_09100 [Arcicella sp.]|jgi:hypothetical protein|nr:hypothetical protein [Arcicella sp.]